MDFPLKRYLKMSRERALVTLIDERVPDAVIPALLEKIETLKSEQRSARISAYQRDATWGPLLRSAKHERKAVRDALNSPLVVKDERRIEAQEAYLLVMNELIRRMEDVLKPMGTPIALAKQRNLSGGDGSHWTDWVPRKIKERITELYAGIPYKRHKGRVKVPFERTILPADNTALKERLIKRTLKELDLVERKLAIPDDAVYPTHPALITRRTQIIRALAKIKDIPPDAPVPATRHKL